MADFFSRRRLLAMVPAAPAIVARTAAEAGVLHQGMRPRRCLVHEKRAVIPLKIGGSYAEDGRSSALVDRSASASPSRRQQLRVDHAGMRAHGENLIESGLMEKLRGEQRVGQFAGGVGCRWGPVVRERQVSALVTLTTLSTLFSTLVAVETLRPDRFRREIRGH